MINRRKAISQVLALLSLENGLFLAAISLTYGMPVVVEAGLFFEVLVGSVGVFVLDDFGKIIRIVIADGSVQGGRSNGSGSHLAHASG